MPTRSGHTSVILASKVVGTPVYAVSGEKIGHVEDVMLDKLSDCLAFAVLGRTLDDGREYLPVPWALLDYDLSREGYLLGLTAEQLKNAPTFAFDELTKGDGRLARERTHRFYSVL